MAMRIQKNTRQENKKKCTKSLFVACDIGNGNFSALPPCIEGMQDGCMLFVDYRKSRDVVFQQPFSFFYGNDNDDYDNNGDKPLAAFFVTMRHITSLTNMLTMEGKEKASIHIDSMPESGSGSGPSYYSHIVLGIEKMDPSEHDGGIQFKITADAYPNLEMEKEEGEIVANNNLSTVCRTLLTTIRVHASHTVETHRDDNDDKMYMHGIRKLSAYIGWFLCEAPLSPFVDMPVIPPCITVEECCRIISKMQLEVYKNNNNPDPVASSTDSEPNCNRVQKKRIPMIDTLQKAEDDCDYVKMMNIRKIERPTKIEEGLTINDERLSVYPVGILTARCISAIPYCNQLASFMRDMSKDYNRETACRMVLGAFNRFRLQQSKKNSQIYNMIDRVAFLEDIECDEMHKYCHYVQNLIQASIQSSIHSYDSVRKNQQQQQQKPYSFVQKSRKIDAVRKTLQFQWDGVMMTLYCVELDPNFSRSDVHYQSRPVAFAFCHHLSSMPFALAGMRYNVYMHIPKEIMENPQIAAPELSPAKRESILQVCFFERSCLFYFFSSSSFQKLIIFKKTGTRECSFSDFCFSSESSSEICSSTKFYYPGLFHASRQAKGSQENAETTSHGLV